MLGGSLVAKQLVASQEGSSSMKLLDYGFKSYNSSLRFWLLRNETFQTVVSDAAT
jgi:hypothetical protein